MHANTKTNDILPCKECGALILSTIHSKNDGLCKPCSDKRDRLHFNFKVNFLHNKAIFNCGIDWDAFVLNFNTNSKIVFADDTKTYSISELSPNGDFAATIANTYVPKDRILRIINIATKEVIFETRDFFAYEVLFTPINNIIICRADVKKALSQRLLFSTLRRRKSYTLFL